MVWNTICNLDCVRDIVESLMRLSESSRARTKDNSRSCTIPCRYYRWALSGTGEAVVAVKSDEANNKLKFAAGRASRDRDSFSILSEQEGTRRRRKTREMIQPSGCITFEGSSLPANCILDFFRSHASHNFSSVRSFSFFLLPLRSFFSSSLIYTHIHTQTRIKFDSASFNHITCSCLS